MSNQMSNSVANLNELFQVTDPSAFKKDPAGYERRNRATLIQLCLHPDKTVRMACATSPLLRDMFVVAMYQAEQDSEIKLALEPRYLACMTKQDQYAQTIDAQKAEIESLRALLAEKKNKK